MRIFNFNRKKEITGVSQVLENKKIIGEFSGINNPDYNFTNTTLLEKIHTKGYISFGLDNLLPQFLNDMYHSSPLHSSICNYKKLSVVGEGVETNTDSLKGMEKVEYTQMMNFFDGDKSVEEIIDQITLDWVVQSSIAFKIEWNEDFTKVIKRHRLAPESVRTGRTDGDRILSFYYCADWRMPNANNAKIEEYPAFDIKDKTNRCQIIRFGQPTPGLRYYSLPSYFPGLNSMKTDAQIPNYQRATLKNGAFASFMITHTMGQPTEEQQDLYLTKFKQFYEGTDNANKAFHTFVDGKDNAPVIESLANNNNDTRFLEMQMSAQRSIFFAHSVAPIILGYTTSGLGSGMEAEAAFVEFHKNFVRPTRKIIEAIINKFFKINGLYIDLKIKNIETEQPTTK